MCLQDIHSAYSRDDLHRAVNQRMAESVDSAQGMHFVMQLVKAPKTGDVMKGPMYWVDEEVIQKDRSSNLTQQANKRGGDVRQLSSGKVMVQNAKWGEISYSRLQKGVACRPIFQAVHFLVDPIRVVGSSGQVNEPPEMNPHQERQGCWRRDEGESKKNNVKAAHLQYHTSTRSKLHMHTTKGLETVVLKPSLLSQPRPRLLNNTIKIRNG